MTVDWSDLLWAAITVGRPNIHYVFRHGDPSFYEALFRWSLLRMSVQQTSAYSRRLYRTAAFKNLDPTEKGAVSYFLGMIVCKVFADKHLNTPWLLHLDVFGPSVRAQLPGRSRPDLVGKEAGTPRWHAFECEGRSSKPDRATIGKAKAQAQRIRSVNGVTCDLNVGAITYFQGDRLDFHCSDPSQSENGARLPRPEREWKAYFAPGYSAYLALRAAGTASIARSDIDVEIEIHPKVRELLAEGLWSEAHSVADDMSLELRENGYRPDGFAVLPGPSWRERYGEVEF